MEISLIGLSKAKVLAALYNASKSQGMGILHFDPKPMMIEEAESLLEKTGRFDYLKGRVIKVDLSGAISSTRGATIVTTVRAQRNVPSRRFI